MKCLKQVRETLKKNEKSAASDTFEDAIFIKNHRFSILSCQIFLEAVIVNMKKRMMECDHLAVKEQGKDRHIHEILNLFEPVFGKVEEDTIPWQAAKVKLNEFQNVFLHEIRIIDVRGYSSEFSFYSSESKSILIKIDYSSESKFKNVLQNFHHHAVPPTIKKAKSITNTCCKFSRSGKRLFSNEYHIFRKEKPPCCFKCIKPFENYFDWPTIGILGPHSFIKNVTQNASHC